MAKERLRSHRWGSRARKTAPEAAVPHLKPVPDRDQIHDAEADDRGVGLDAGLLAVSDVPEAGDKEHLGEAVAGVDPLPTQKRP